MSEIDWEARAEAAEAREAVLREALAVAANYVEGHAPEYWDTPPDVQQLRAALTSTAEAAVARDARIRDEGRREGIEEAARVADEFGLDAASAIRALLDTPAKGGADE